MLIYKDLIADKEIGSDSYDSKELCDGAVLALESKKIQIGGDEKIDIGANASAEGDVEEEGVDASEVKYEINIVAAHQLQKIELDLKTFKTMQKKYWKDLKQKIESMRYSALGLSDDYKPPEDKKEAKKAEDAALSKLSKFDKVEFTTVNERFEKFKKAWEKLQKFVADEIEKNFKEYEFFMAPETDLGSGMIIPARYIGEALSPTFYYYRVGLLDEKQ